jgi:hypothetical protein
LVDWVTFGVMALVVLMVVLWDNRPRKKKGKNDR